MPTASSVFLASLVIAVPSVSVGAYYLSSPSTSSQEQFDEATVVKPANPAKNDTQPELTASQPTVPAESKVEIAQPQSKPWLDKAKSELTNLKTNFPYENLIKDSTGKLEAFQNFVSETDKIRTGLTNTISELLQQPENKGKSLKNIFEKDLGLKLVSESENETWDKLAKLRKEEAEAQVDSTDSLDKTQKQPSGGDTVTSENISNFCKSPTKDNSHLGMYDPRRKEQEESEDYRFFTYYSYCTKDSFYLSDQLVFEKKNQ